MCLCYTPDIRFCQKSNFTPEISKYLLCYKCQDNDKFLTVNSHQSVRTLCHHSCTADGDGPYHHYSLYVLGTLEAGYVEREQVEVLAN